MRRLRVAGPAEAGHAEVDLAAVGLGSCPGRVLDRLMRLGPALSGEARRHGLVFMAAVLAMWTVGCAGRTAAWEANWDAPYAAFGSDEQVQFTAARGLLDDGQRLAGLGALQELAGLNGGNLELACWLQDVEAELLLDGVEARRIFPELADSVDRAAYGIGEGEPGEVIRRVYAARASALPTVEALILAARVETDGLAAESLLRRALELDPVCSWAHYGLSHVLLEKRSQPDRWSLARASLERALEIEPGNLRARRLEAWMLAEEGSRDVAEKQLRRWLEEAAEDPRVSRVEAVEARLDLALLLLLRGEDRRAARLLEDLEGEPVGRARRWMLLTVARQEGGDLLGALDATLRAQGAAAGEVLPLVQEALLSEAFLDRPEVASALWEEVAELAEDGATIGDLVQTLRARVRMERSRSAPQVEIP
ncbi:hypothetical protein N9Z54_05125 [Planctomycetota bacterium]|nr:hypothetical protein [Planctomycetota bacterium]